MTDTPRETIMIELTRRASEGCEGLGDVACFRDLPLMEQWCDPCRCQEAAKIIRRQAAECDTLRAQLADMTKTAQSCGAQADEWIAKYQRVKTRLAETRTLAKIGTWHEDCRPNRQMAARELQKSQAVIDKLADEISSLNAQLAAEREKHDEEAYNDMAAEVARLKALPPGSQCEREDGSGCCCAECCAYCAADLRTRLAEAEAQLAELKAY